MTGPISLLMMLAAQAVAPCATPEQHALDFWIGKWEVFDTASNVPIAKNEVQSIFDGCAIEERYAQSIGPGGQPSNYQGRSFSAFNNVDLKWHQFYVDVAGAAFSYAGSSSGTGMVLTATAGTRVIRMTLRPEGEGNVRQIGEVSSDGGKSWKPNFDFTYRRPAK